MAMGNDGKPIYAENIDGKPLKKCPLRFITPWVSHMMGLYSHYKNGFLPYSGGVLDQPAKIMKSIALISRTDVEAQQEITKRRK